MGIVKHIYEVQQETLREVLKDIEATSNPRRVGDMMYYSCDTGKLTAKIQARIDEVLKIAKEQDDE